MRLKILATLLASGAAASAAQFPLVDTGALMFGDVETITAHNEDTLPDLARRHGLGYEEILRANPGVDTWLPGEGTTVVVPGQRLLPAGPREGIVINLPEHRLYYFAPAKKGEVPQVITYPVSIGKMDWATPLGRTKIVDKRKNPTWTPPESIRKEHAERGDPLPRVVPAGPNNPLGLFAMRLNISPGAYLIHGTNNPIAVGMAVTHGCIRMYPEDIEALFPLVKVGTPVWLINQPVKVARVGGQVWLEVHPPIDAQGQQAEVDLEGFYAMANAALGETPAAIHWDLVLETLKDASGLPQMIGLEMDPADVPQLAPEVSAEAPQEPALESTNETPQQATPATPGDTPAETAPEAPTEPAPESSPETSEAPPARSGAAL